MDAVLPVTACLSGHPFSFPNVITTKHLSALFEGFQTNKCQVDWKL